MISFNPIVGWCAQAWGKRVGAATTLIAAMRQPRAERRVAAMVYSAICLMFIGLGAIRVWEMQQMERCEYPAPPRWASTREGFGPAVRPYQPDGGTAAISADGVVIFYSL